MSFASKVLYTGDGSTASYNVPMPYISRTHINVYVDQILQLDPMSYTWSNTSTIQFAASSVPGDGSAIEIRRSTSPTNTLVDFANGSVLSEQELDAAYLHNFYLSQEYADSFNETINNALVNVATGAGIVETETDAVIAALVNEMVSDAAAANLQARITDIDDNAEAIITLGEGIQVQLNTLASGVAATVFIQDGEPVPGVDGVVDPIPEGSRWYDSDDNNAPYIYQSSAWVDINDPRIGNAVADITVLQSETGDNAAAIVAETLARTNADSALASSLTLLGAQNGGGTAFVLDLATTFVGASESLATRLSTISAGIDDNAAEVIVNAAAVAAVEGDVTTLYAKYGVTLNVNGYITGFAQNNDGTTGSFVILADKFAVVDPSGDPAEPEYSPFSISGGKIVMTGDVEVNGSLLVNGSVVGAALVAGTIGTTQIGANAITATQINADAVTADKILANAVTATKINVTNLAAVSADLGDITAGTITMDTSGYIQGGQTAYNTGTGFFLGYDTDAYKFSIGDSSSNYLTWDGTTLSIQGDFVVGDYIVSTNVMLSAPTEQTSSNRFGWTEKKAFTIDRDGDVRIQAEVRHASGTVGTTTARWRIMINGVQDGSDRDIVWTTYTTDSQDITVSAGDEITVDIIAADNGVGAGSLTVYIKDVEVRGEVLITATGGTVDTD